MARRPASDPTTRHPSQLLALAIGAVYTLIGILGFLVTGFENLATETNKTLGCSLPGTATSTSCP